MMWFAQSPRQLTGVTVAAAGVLAAALMFAFVFQASPPPSVNLYYEPPRPAPALDHPLQPIFEFWNDPQPELVIVLSAQMYGYLQACGCSRPQVGGLERRYELIRQLEAKGWPTSKADLGDLAIRPTDPAYVRRIPAQVRLKYEMSLRMLKEMKYAAVGFGGTEFALSMDDALGLALNFQPPYILMANFNDKDGLYADMFRTWTLDVISPQGASTTRRTWKVAYVGLVSESVLAKAKETDKRPDSPLTLFEPPDQALARVLPEVEKAAPDLRVLLFQGSEEEARKLNQKHKAFQIVVCLSDADKAPTLARTHDGVPFVQLGHKGLSVGLAGVWPQPDGKLRLQYRSVDLTEPLELPREKTNPVRERMKDYVAGVYFDKFLEKWPRSSHPLQLEAISKDSRYAGSESCRECHPSAYAKWKESKHGKAYQALIDYGLPVAEVRRKPGEPPLLLGRQFDPDCVRCHTTGFDYKTGYVSEQLTPHLKGNGCENCHGPASLHVANKDDPNFRKMLRLPLSAAANKCRECHDGDNDPNFMKHGDPRYSFEAYWEKIKHGKN